MTLVLQKNIRMGGNSPSNHQIKAAAKKAVAKFAKDEKDGRKILNLSRALAKMKKELDEKDRAPQAPYHHRQFNAAMKRLVAPVLIKAVETGEIDFFTSMRAEAQINKSMRDPNYQINQHLLGFLIRKLTKKPQKG